LEAETTVSFFGMSSTFVFFKDAGFMIGPSESESVESTRTMAFFFRFPASSSFTFDAEPGDFDDFGAIDVKKFRMSPLTAAVLGLLGGCHVTKTKKT
jgi:hypothetical protein